jgi:hypothetical protein
MARMAPPREPKAERDTSRAKAALIAGALFSLLGVAAAYRWQSDPELARLTFIELFTGSGLGKLFVMAALGVAAMILGAIGLLRGR